MPSPGREPVETIPIATDRLRGYAGWATKLECSELLDKQTYYLYTPTNILPVCFALAFALSSIANVWLSYRKKTLRYTLYHPICCVLFVIAFTLREYGTVHKGCYIIFHTSDTVIDIAIPILGLANYHILARLFRYIPTAAVINPRRLLVALGIVTGLVEIFNIVILARIPCAPPRDVQTTFSNILAKTSLIIQLSTIVLLFILTLIFHYRCWKAGIDSKTKNLWRPMVVLYTSMTFVLYPTEFRLIAQFAKEDPFKTYEWYFYFFVGLPMVLNEVTWIVWHPGFSLPSDSGATLGEEAGGEDERRGLLNGEAGGYGVA